MTSPCHTLVAKPPVDPSHYAHFKPGRLDHVYLYDESDADASSSFPRYHLYILDRNDIQQQQHSSTKKSFIQYPCAVFLIPAGRESDYTFSKYVGLLHVAQSAACSRLIAVAFHRNHIYESQELVQAELEYITQVIAHQGSFFVPDVQRRNGLQQQQQQVQIPFMAMNGLGKRNIIAQGESSMTGKYIVEEVELESIREGQVCIARRLFFLQNENVIQTQVFMTQLVNCQQPPQLDVESLAFDYHCSIAMGVIALGSSLLLSLDTPVHVDSTADTDSTLGVVIGLGGGGLLNFLKAFFPPVAWTVIELDPYIVELAKNYFGFQEDLQRLKVHVGDGLSIRIRDSDTSSHRDDDFQKSEHPPKDVIQLDASSIAFFIIDVDSKDVTVGMSCPPESFVTIEYLSRIHHILQDGGVLALNVSARDPVLLDRVLDHVQSVFQSNIFVSSSKSQEGSGNDDDDDDEMEDELNTVVFCKKSTTQKQYNLPSPMELINQLSKMCHINQMKESSKMKDWEESITGIRKWNPLRRQVDDTLVKDIQKMSIEKVKQNRKKSKRKKK